MALLPNPSGRWREPQDEPWKLENCLLANILEQSRSGGHRISLGLRPRAVLPALRTGQALVPQDRCQEETLYTKLTAPS